MGSSFGDLGKAASFSFDTAANMVTLGGYGGMKAAEAQGDIAKAQEAEQRAMRAEALKYAEATPEELAQLNRSIALNESDIARKEKLLASSDPALIEAGTQALQLLRGEEAKTLAPLRSNIAKQESALRSKLAAQLGSGYENITAGIQALQAFNEQSNNAMANAQQATIGQLLGVAQDTSSRYGAQSNIANSGTIGGLFGNIQNRKISALTGTPITGAGSQFVGDLQSARAGQSVFNNALKIAGMAAGAGGGSGGTPGTIQAASNTNPYSLNA